ncbi:hypothetical protein BN1708_014954 [Verticillium longisporum]|uniref:Chromatin modification-related protein EAF3 n=1 Tax=Verticillium longisporum TaxID=100787 RepID=A0A0G4M098_VERLO|nr:hypothetical protein BN1708_014954 [Verticillium longisporum]
MAPARQPDQASFAKDERVLCFHHEMLYEAKVLDIQPPETENDVYQYRVHYKGWKNTWDDWVAPDRIRKFTESNKELAAQLHAQMKNLQKSTSKVPKKGLRPNGTDSARGSEERSASLFATGRGPRRTRDYELETATGLAATLNSIAKTITKTIANDYQTTLSDKQSLSSCSHREEGAKKPFSSSQITVVSREASHATQQSQVPAVNGGHSAHGEEQLQYSEDEDYDPTYDTAEETPPPPTAAQLQDMERRWRREQNERMRQTQKYLEEMFPDTYGWATYLMQRGVPSRSPAETEAAKANVEEFFSFTEHTLWNKIDWSQTKVRPSYVSTWREPPRAYDSFKRLPRQDHLYVDPAGKCLFDKKYVYYGQRVNKTAAAKSLEKKKAQKKVEKRLEKQTERRATPSALKFQDKATVDGPVTKHAEQQTQPAEKTRNPPYGEWSLTVWGCVVTLPGCSIARPDTQEPQIGSISSFEDGFHTRPSIRLPVPDHIKGILVDDWENVTKNNQLVPLPHPHPVDQIINDYLEYERPSRDPESPHVDILEETMAGLKEYFEKSLSRILLYRFERPQYHEIRKEWEKTGENGPKSVCDTYGAEHLCRLIVSLPELVAQTTMDQQSVSRLREEISKFTVWLGKNATKYFVSEYETPAQEYIDRARNI